MSELKKIIAERITKLRNDRGWTQEVAARKLSEIYPEPISRQRWGNWELGGYRTPKDPQIVALAKLFGVSPGYIKGFTNNEADDGALQDYITANSPTITGKHGIVRTEQASGSIAFNTDKLRERGLNQNRIFLARATDTSMQGVINEGDDFLIDLDKTEVVDADIFAFIVKDRIWTRWIRPELDGTYTLAAQDAEHFPERQLSAEALADLDIVDRVALICRYR